MHISELHPWPNDADEARAIQDTLRTRIDVSTPVRPAQVRYVAGVDVAYAKADDRLAAAVVVLDLATFETVETQVAVGVPRFDYVPGLFAFRELPVLLDAMRRLEKAPDLIVCDGHGVAHPQRFGLACHLGLLADRPTFGVAKTPFVGSYTDPRPERAAWSPLTDGQDVIGRVLRTQDNTKPVFVSAGHRITLEDATTFTLSLCRTYRLPETTRLADQLSRRTLAG